MKLPVASRGGLCKEICRKHARKVIEMAISKLDIGLLLFYYLGFSFFRNQSFKHKPVARFIVFHDIMPNKNKIFARNLRVLKKKTNVISMDDFFGGRLSSNKINTVITFDDGYKSWIIDVLPVLRYLDLPATFFVSSGFVGLAPDEESRFTRKYLFKKRPPRIISGGLTTEDLKIIADSNQTVGGHTTHHVDLELLKDRHQITDEIMDDKHNLETIIGKKISYFSYPTGTYKNTDVNLAAILKDAGYRGAVTVDPGFNTAETNPYQLHRDIAGEEMKARVFIAQALGNHDAISFIKTKLRTDHGKPLQNGFTNQSIK